MDFTNCGGGDGVCVCACVSVCVYLQLCKLLYDLQRGRFQSPVSCFVEYFSHIKTNLLKDILKTLISSYLLVDTLYTIIKRTTKKMLVADETKSDQQSWDFILRRKLKTDTVQLC